MLNNIRRRACGIFSVCTTFVANSTSFRPESCSVIKPILMFCQSNLKMSAIFCSLGTKLDPTELICGVLLCSKAFNGPFGVKRHLIQSDPVSDGSPRWCPLVIEVLSVSVNCWSLARVRLMTLRLTGSPAIINLVPLKTAHYRMHLICCRVPKCLRVFMWMVDDVLPLPVLCKPRRMSLPKTK